MNDLLRRSIAPLTAAAWDEIDDTARQIFKAQLTGRTLVDFDGPHGWELAAVNTGRLDVSKRAAPGGVPWGLRQVQPLVEVRVPFTLNQFEVDNITRGCKNADLSALEQATRNVALFEETAIFKGFSAGQIPGMIAESDHKAIALPKDARKYTQAVAQGLKALHEKGIDGPYALVLGPDPFHELAQLGEGGYPPRRIIRDMIGGEILRSPALTGGVLLSTRGGDFEMTVGQDLAIGYASHSRDTIEFFLTESFTFRVLEPAALVELKPATR